jgi:polyferredoxin
VNPFLITLAAVLIFTILFGRFFCGYGCSFGTYGDTLYWLFSRLRLFIRRKLGKKSAKRLPKIPQKAATVLRYGKYAVLILIMYLCMSDHAAVITSYSPWTVFSMLQKLAIPTSGKAAIGLFAAISAGMMLEPRFFCRFLCPLGAIFSMMPVLPFSSIRRDREACRKGCSLCTCSCPAAIELPDIHNEDVTNLSGECFQCGNCVYHCPKANCSGIVNPGDIRGLIWQCVRSVLLISLCFYLTHKLV